MQCVAISFAVGIAVAISPVAYALSIRACGQCLGYNAPGESGQLFRYGTRVQVKTRFERMMAASGSLPWLVMFTAPCGAILCVTALLSCVFDRR